MLHVTGDMIISRGNDTLKIKTNDDNQLVLTFSSWTLFGEFMRLRKMANTDISNLRKKLKHLTTPMKIEIGSDHSFLMVKGKPSSMSISTIFRIIRHFLFK